MSGWLLQFPFEVCYSDTLASQPALLHTWVFPIQLLARKGNVFFASVTWNSDHDLDRVKLNHRVMNYCIPVCIGHVAGKPDEYMMTAGTAFPDM